MRLDEITNKQRLDESPILDFLITTLQVGTGVYLTLQAARLAKRVHGDFQQFKHKWNEKERIVSELRSRGLKLTKQDEAHITRMLTDPEYLAQVEKRTVDSVMQMASSHLNRLLVQIEESFGEEEQRQLLPLINDAKRAVMERDLEKLVAVEQLDKIVDRFAPRQS